MHQCAEWHKRCAERTSVDGHRNWLVDERETTWVGERQVFDHRVGFLCTRRRQIDRPTSQFTPPIPLWMQIQLFFRGQVNRKFGLIEYQNLETFTKFSHKKVQREGIWAIFALQILDILAIFSGT